MWSSNDTTFYADAIGFSWDANYAIGENYECGNITDFYAYSSTKLDGFSPCLMNLPADALKLIIWLRDYENSDQGKKPQNFNAYLEQWWASVWDKAQEEFQKVVDNLVLFFVENFPWAWLLVRAALLIFIAIVVGLAMFSIASMYALLVPFAEMTEELFGASYQFGSLTINVFGKTLKIDSDIEWQYNEIFKMDFPILVDLIEVDGKIVKKTMTGLIDSFSRELLDPFDLPLESSNEAFNLDVFSAFYTWTLLLCGILPTICFTFSATLHKKQHNHYGIALSIGGCMASIFAFIELIKWLKDGGKALPINTIGPIPIPSGDLVKSNKYSGVYGMIVAFLFISFAFSLVLLRAKDFQKIINSVILGLITNTMADVILAQLDSIFSGMNIDIIDYVFSGICMVLDLVGFFLSTIAMAQEIYGKNFIKKNKDGTNNMASPTTTPQIAKIMPKLYAIFVDIAIGFCFGMLFAIIEEN